MLELKWDEIEAYAESRLTINRTDAGIEIKKKMKDYHDPFNY